MENDVVMMPPQKDLPPGPTYWCLDCGTRLRTGQPHIATEPQPHASLSMLVVEG